LPALKWYDIAHLADLGERKFVPCFACSKVCLALFRLIAAGAMVASTEDDSFCPSLGEGPQRFLHGVLHDMSLLNYAINQLKSAAIMALLSRSVQAR